MKKHQKQTDAAYATGVDVIARKSPKVSERKASVIMRKVTKGFANVPPEELARAPTDLSYNHDHYIYGSPKL